VATSVGDPDIDLPLHWRYLLDSLLPEDSTEDGCAHYFVSSCSRWRPQTFLSAPGLRAWPLGRPGVLASNPLLGPFSPGKRARRFCC